MRQALIFGLFFGMSCSAFAQMPQPGIIYMILNNQIYNYDPSLPLSQSNPSLNTISAPMNSTAALAVGPNLNALGPSPTFYTLVGQNQYAYFDGNAWVNTGHTAGNVNIGAGGPYIYSIEGGAANITKYDGIGNATYLMNILDFEGGGPYDLHGDCDGNFYLLRLQSVTGLPWLRKYDPQGNLLQQWTVTGAESAASGPGMSIIGDKIYYSNITGFWVGIIGATNVHFTKVANTFNIIWPGFSPGDYAAFPLPTSQQTIAGFMAPDSACINSSIHFQNTTIGGSSQYSWDFGDGTTDTSTNPTHTYLGVGTYLVRLIVRESLCIPPDTCYDSVKVLSAHADFSYNINYGCYADTIIFTSHSTTGVSHHWDFGDNTFDTVRDPQHVFSSQGVYSVALIVNNGVCSDTTEKLINIEHPLSASFLASKDTICTGGKVIFTNTSIYTPPGKFQWMFGNGGIDTSMHPVHIFSDTGTYKVTLVITDFLGCSDTFSHFIVVDPAPFVHVYVSDSAICEGQSVLFSAAFLDEGSTGIRWDFGDGNMITNQSSVLHAFDTSGIFKIQFTASYRICDDTSATEQVEIIPFPRVNLGPDTFMCPGSSVLLLKDTLNVTTTGAFWRWSNGDTSYRTFVRHPGRYSVTVKVNGCENSDTVEIFKDCYIDIPNAFSPNGDGINDYFFPRQLLSRGLIGFRMKIFNRWGEVIFSTNRVDGRGWDGKFNDTEQPQGVYIYLIEAALKNGVTEKYQGNVTLIR